tara:strand:+ start:1149 stop:1361 length:213 start_codon:yes stop_codon:yes gene_type:complete
MKVTKVTKIYRPMKVWGKLIKDLFFSSSIKSTHKWCRYKMYFDNKSEQKKFNTKLIKAILNNQIVGNENN